MAFTPLFGGNLWLVEDIPAKPERNAANSFAQSRVRLHLTPSERAGRNPFFPGCPQKCLHYKTKVPPLVTQLLAGWLGEINRAWAHKNRVY